MNLTSLALGLSALVAPVTASTDGNWYADYDEALAVAKAADKDLIVDFTGSDWCHWCIKLHEEVFSKQEWIDAASKDYVFVALDFPNGEEAKAKVPNPARNRELAELHGVAGYPTILLVSSDGVAFAKTGYQAGGPTAYLEHMNEIATSGRVAMAKAEGLVKAFDAAEGEAKWKAWDSVVTLFVGLADRSPFISTLAPTVHWGFTSDPGNKLGHRLRAARTLLKKGAAPKDVMDAIPALDPKNANGLMELLADSKFQKVRDDATARAALVALDRVNEHGFQDEELGFRMNLMAAQWCSGPLADPEGKAKYAAIATKIGTSDPRAQEALKKLNG